jgi:hypothetical protein
MGMRISLEDYFNAVMFVVKEVDDPMITKEKARDITKKLFDENKIPFVESVFDKAFLEFRTAVKQKPITFGNA